MFHNKPVNRSDGLNLKGMRFACSKCLRQFSKVLTYRAAFVQGCAEALHISVNIAIVLNALLRGLAAFELHNLCNSSRNVEIPVLAPTLTTVFLSERYVC